jgi:hypothetical protein
LQPLRAEIVQNTVVLSFKQSYERMLEQVAGLTAKGEVLHLELGGASLEDIFLELTKT